MQFKVHEESPLTRNFDDLLVSDQIVLIEDCIVLGQIPVAALFLLPAEDGAVHCKLKTRRGKERG